MTGRITFNSVNEFFSITFDQNGIEYNSSVNPSLFSVREMCYFLKRKYIFHHIQYDCVQYSQISFYFLMPKNRNLDGQDWKFMNAVPVVIFSCFIHHSRNSSYDKNNKGNSGSDNAMSPTHFAVPIVVVCKEHLILIAAASLVEGYWKLAVLFDKSRAI